MAQYRKIGNPDKSQTAVEWLVKELSLEGYDFTVEQVEQAKAMEKEQCINDYKHGQNNGYMYRDGIGNMIDAEQYYNETYGS